MIQIKRRAYQGIGFCSEGVDIVVQAELIEIIRFQQKRLAAFEQVSRHGVRCSGIDFKLQTLEIRVVLVTIIGKLYKLFAMAFLPQGDKEIPGIGKAADDFLQGPVEILLLRDDMGLFADFIEGLSQLFGILQRGHRFLEGGNFPHALHL